LFCHPLPSELQNRFKELTGVADPQTQRFYLESSGWNLELATTMYFENSGSGATPKAAFNPVGDVGHKPAVAKPAPSRKVGVIGFSDLGNQQQQEKGLEYYSGGKSSGMMVQAPQPNKEQDIASTLLESAKRSAGSGEAPKPSGDIKTRTLTFWKQGFTIDDGSLRLYDDPANKAFLEAVNRGVAPPELASSSEEIDTILVDKKSEDYKAPPPKPFSGSGHTLGGSSSNTTTVQHTSHSSKTRPPFELDTSQPITSIQIRMHDGTRLVAKFNHHHTIGDIRDFVDRALPGKLAYQLQTTFPVKVLADEDQTIASAGLLNAVILQKPL